MMITIGKDECSVKLPKEVKVLDGTCVGLSIIKDTIKIDLQADPQKQLCVLSKGNCIEVPSIFRNSMYFRDKETFRIELVDGGSVMLLKAI